MPVPPSGAGGRITRSGGKKTRGGGSLRRPVYAASHQHYQQPGEPSWTTAAFGAAAVPT